MPSSFSIVNDPIKLSWYEQDALDRIMALPGAIAAEVGGRNEEDELVVAVRFADDEFDADPALVLVREDAYGISFSTSGTTYLPMIEEMTL